MYQLKRLGVGLCLAALAACEDPTAAPVDELAAAPHTPLATISRSNVLTTGSLGPVTYGFAPELLTRAEIQLPLPPAYTMSVWATKLIPISRAAALGEDSCRYGQAEPLQTCTAEKEDGLTIALLERPLADYRAAFVRAGSGEALQPATLAGSSGFAFLASTQDARATYGFYAVEDRTLLVARQSSGTGGRALDAAFQEVLESLHLPEKEP